MSAEREPHSTAAAMERWARLRSGSPVLARAIGMAAKAEAEGHACARFDADGIDLATLRNHRWVGDGNSLTPTVLTTDGDFFLWRNWRHEERIASAIAARMAAVETIDDPKVEADLRTLFPGTVGCSDRSAAEDPHAAQRRAAREVVGKRFFILSGGPGTGKTTTVLRMLLMLLRAAARADRRLSVALAAPTGKAAQRLSQSLRDGADKLRQQLGDDRGTWESALDALPDSARTLHRLLAWQPHLDRFGFDAGNPLPFELVVVDEASMVDLGLMRALLDALAPKAALILLGDPDQLVSVSAGSVLADLVASAAEPPLANHHVRLQHVWRAEGRLAEVYEAVRIGSRRSLVPLLTADVGAQWHLLDDAAALRQRLLHWLRREEWSDLDRIGAAAEPQPVAAFAALRKLQLLTALRDGPFGAIRINDWIDARRRQQHDGSVWYPGRPIMVRHNDYSRRLFNGDIGLTIRHNGQLSVCFESTNADGLIDYRYLSPRELPEHDFGYALTIHKSQGSEYDHVAVLLPPDADHRILARQLLYTGVSRARRSLEIWSSEASLTAALERLSVRDGGLRRRLAGL
jgi:exodeoxyribonuclease V alpha subunit